MMDDGGARSSTEMGPSRKGSIRWSSSPSYAKGPVISWRPYGNYAMRYGRLPDLDEYGHIRRNRSLIAFHCSVLDVLFLWQSVTSNLKRAHVYSISRNQHSFGHFILFGRSVFLILSTISFSFVKYSSLRFLS